MKFEEDENPGVLPDNTCLEINLVYNDKYMFDAAMNINFYTTYIDFSGQRINATDFYKWADIEIDGRMRADVYAHIHMGWCPQNDGPWGDFHRGDYSGYEQLSEIKDEISADGEIIKGGYGADVLCVR